MRAAHGGSVWRLGCALALGALASACWQAPALGQETAIGLQCAASCSVQKDGVAIARLSWDPIALQPDRARLDWTVYKNGFRDEVFASFTPLVPQPELRAAFSNPTLRDARPFRLRLVGIERAADERWISGLTVENLEPGVNYSFRLQFERDGRRLISETAICPAPVCIRDEER